MKEKNRLESVAGNSLYTTMCNRATIEYSYEIFKRFLNPGNILEMGPAEGLMTKKLYTLTDHLFLLEGSQLFCNSLIKSFPKAEVICSLFEEFTPKTSFNNIILGHVLEHVENPIQILKLARSWLRKDGIIMAAVPNSHSIHRQAAVIMGLLESEKSMSKLDEHHGHRRIYNPEMLKSHFRKANLKIKGFGGYWLKPISNEQIHKTWNMDMLNAFMKLGEAYPEIAAEIYIIASR